VSQRWRYTAGLAFQLLVGFVIAGLSFRAAAAYFAGATIALWSYLIVRSGTAPNQEKGK
jgi:hypothetical protein